MSIAARWIAPSLALLLAPAVSYPLDLGSPQGVLEAYVRANGDTSGKDRLTYGSTTVYAFVPGEKARPLFRLEVVGASRYEAVEGGYRRLHREVGYYTDLATGEVLKRWYNPFIEREVEVIPIQNDPVNRSFVVDPANGSTGIRFYEDGDWVVFYREIPLRYPNPLSRAAYPRHSSGDFYEAMELFNTFVRRPDLEDDRATAVPSSGSWSRIGPWLPWMEMGNAQGWLVYHGRSVTLDSAAGLPARLRSYVEAHHPKYLRAPEQWGDSNETSWTVFKDVIDRRRREEAATR